MSRRTKTEQEIYAGKPVSAVVYIWYPCHRFSVGHASIYIGSVPKCPWAMGFPENPANNNYVSFLADTNIRQGIISVKGVLNNIQDDFVVRPHLEYYLVDLNVEEMQRQKCEIHNGKRYGNHHVSHSYNVINKNCSTMVAKILKAGGVEHLLTLSQRIGYAKNLYWTPKDIAQLCNELRNNDKAVKIRELNCPDKLDSPFKTLMGFR